MWAARHATALWLGAVSVGFVAWELLFENGWLL